jgi:hypothetical protein
MQPQGTYSCASGKTPAGNGLSPRQFFRIVAHLYGETDGTKKSPDNGTISSGLLKLPASLASLRCFGVKGSDHIRGDYAYLDDPCLVKQESGNKITRLFLVPYID